MKRLLATAALGVGLAFGTVAAGQTFRNPPPQDPSMLQASTYATVSRSYSIGDDGARPERLIPRIKLYERAHQHGHSIGITRDTPDLASRRFDAAAASILVQAGVWDLCDRPNYQGHCQRVSSDAELAAFGLDHQISSVRQVRSHRR